MKGWYGDKMRHSMSAKGITTAQYVRTVDKERSNYRKQALIERQNYLSNYHSDWFIDKLMIYKPSEFKTAEWMKITKKNRETRIKEAIGREVFLGFGYVIDDLYGIEGVLKDIGKNYVTVEIDDDELKVRDFTIRYIKRDEPLKPKKPRKVNIPKGEFRFRLKEDTNKIERYEAFPELLEGCKLIPVVDMYYHSKYKVWDVSYRFLYGDKYSYSTPSIKSRGNINNRREARKLAMSFIERASKKDVENLSNNIKQEIKRSCMI